MLARKYKLSAFFFRKVRREGLQPVRSMATNLFRVRCYISSLSHGRCACIVQNSAFKSIVQRNAFRRAFYEAARKTGLHEIPGTDFVFLANKSGGNPEGGDIEKDLLYIRSLFLKN